MPENPPLALNYARPLPANPQWTLVRLPDDGCAVLAGASNVTLASLRPSPRWYRVVKFGLACSMLLAFLGIFAAIGVIRIWRTREYPMIASVAILLVMAFALALWRIFEPVRASISFNPDAPRLALGPHFLFVGREVRGADGHALGRVRWFHHSPFIGAPENRGRIITINRDHFETRAVRSGSKLLKPLVLELRPKGQPDVLAWLSCDGPSIRVAFQPDLPDCLDPRLFLALLYSAG